MHRKLSTNHHGDGRAAREEGRRKKGGGEGKEERKKIMQPHPSWTQMQNCWQNISEYALAGVAQWTKCQPVNQRVAGLIPSQGTCLGCRLGPQ